MRSALLLIGGLSFQALYGQTPTISSVVDAAGFAPRLAPGSLANIFGTNLGTSTSIPVMVSGKAAAVLFATPSQLLIQIPMAAPVGLAPVIAGGSAPVSITLTQYAPALFTANSQGTGPITAAHASGAVVSPAAPALPNEAITIYAIGLGPTDPVVPDGTKAPSNPIAATRQMPVVNVGGQAATVISAALTPGQIGYYQVSFILRADAPQGSPPITIGIGGATSTAATTLPVGAPPAPPPTVVNSASNAFPGFPNAGVAPGSIFVAYGANMGPAALVLAAGYPWKTTLGGTSASVTVNGQTVAIPLYYTSASQIAGLLPSSTPVGTGTFRVTYNGVPGPTGVITVVQNNLGVYTVSQDGAGQGIVTYADYSLVSPAKAANAGDTLIIWATGLGAVAGDELAGALPGDMPNIPLKVWVGGIPANVVYRGRSGCCVGEDQIAFVVPGGVVGCNVPLVLQINNQVSNNSTMAIAAGGRTCTPAIAGQPVDGLIGRSEVNLAYLSLSRSSVPSSSGTAVVKSDDAQGQFLRIGNPGTQVASALGTQPIGSCLVTTSTFTGNSGATSDSTKGLTFTPLDAGPALTINGPNGVRTIAKAQGGVYSGHLGDTTPGNYLDPGNYTVTGPGGADVGKFTAPIALPQSLVWSNQASMTTVTRTAGLTVNWTGGDPKGAVTVEGDSSFLSTTGAGVKAAFTCVAAATDLTFTVPAWVLLSLPAGQGSLSVSSIVLPSPFTASGADYGILVSDAKTQVQMQYK